MSVLTAESENWSLPLLPVPPPPPVSWLQPLRFKKAE